MWASRSVSANSPWTSLLLLQRSIFISSHPTSGALLPYVEPVRSDPTSSHSYMPSIDLSVLNTLHYDFIPDTTYFLQLEDPETCAALTIDFLEKQALAHDFSVS